MEDIKAKIHGLEKLWEVRNYFFHMHIFFFAHVISTQSAPEELKVAAPGIITNATDIISTATIYWTELQPLQSIAEHLVEGVQVSPEFANTCLNNVTTNAYAIQNRDALFQGMTSNEACSDVVRQGMQDMMGAAANKILIVGVVSAGICAAIEGYKAYKLWELIKDAKNLVQKTPGQRDMISDRLSDIKRLVKSLDKAIADLRTNDTAREDLDGAKLAADHFINEIRINVGEFLKEICKR